MEDYFLWRFENIEAFASLETQIDHEDRRQSAEKTFWIERDAIFFIRVVDLKKTMWYCKRLFFTNRHKVLASDKYASRREVRDQCSQQLRRYNRNLRRFRKYHRDQYNQLDNQGREEDRSSR